MAVPGCPKAALQQVNQFWSMLDEMSQNNPESYRKFIERQMREGAEFHSPPQPDSCLRTSILGAKEGILYVNVCGWKRVPAPTSQTQPVPVCGGRLETETEGNEVYSVLDVAFSPEVLQEAERDGREQVHLLALSFAQKQHGLRLSRPYAVTSATLKGSVENMKRRLTSPHQPSKPTQPDPAPSLLQQILTLRQGEDQDQDQDQDEPSIQLTAGPGDGQAKAGLIEVISSTEAPRPPQPQHQLTVSRDGGAARSLELSVQLPGLSSVSECQLSVSQDDVLLEVEGVYYLHLQFPEAVNEETASATFNKKKRTLSVTVWVL